MKKSTLVGGYLSFVNWGSYVVILLGRNTHFCNLFNQSSTFQHHQFSNTISGPRRSGCCSSYPKFISLCLWLCSVCTTPQASTHQVNFLSITMHFCWVCHTSKGISVLPSSNTSIICHNGCFPWRYNVLLQAWTSGGVSKGNLDSRLCEDGNQDVITWIYVVHWILVVITHRLDKNKKWVNWI